MVGIYKIENLINGKVYIGQSVDIKRRWRRHKQDAEFSDFTLHQAIRKYGIENFSFEVLEECDIAELDEKEIQYIKQYDSYNNGYNETTGGQGEGGGSKPVKITDEQLLEIVDLLKSSNITQNEIAKRYNVGIDTISTINNGKSRRLDNVDYPIRQNSHKHLCVDCGKPITRQATRCLECRGKAIRSVDRPSREELKNMIRTMTFVDIGKRYGVGDNAIRKWCISANLPSRKKDITAMSNDEWELI